ncbi:hypothetical protein SPHINGOT1_60013 [Sphingomonas sp. T1]|nr:hypothetical protein SPHINGOT1_60013 [Sphingomonas sp. T1]
MAGRGVDRHPADDGGRGVRRVGRGQWLDRGWRAYRRVSGGAGARAAVVVVAVPDGLIAGCGFSGPKFFRHPDERQDPELRNVSPVALGPDFRRDDGRGMDVLRQP